MDLIKIWFDSNLNLQIFINKWFVVLVFIAIILWLLYIKFFKHIKGGTFEIDEAEIGIGNQKIKIRPNYEDMQIAYKLWVELSTRKIGLPIDFENDVIVEVYNSWYDFFRLTRELIKDIPVSKIRKNKSTRKLVDVAIDVLNEGLRPHLTLWQAKFRRWYEIESQKDENRNITPQDLQKKFPDFDRLTREMQEVNQKLTKYRQKLKEIAMES